MGTVLRITRHPLDDGRKTSLKEIFGSDIRIVDNDLPYGNDPVGAVLAEMNKIGDVCAVEITGFNPSIIKLVEARNSHDKSRQINVPLIRAEFKRDEGGRAIVTGKDGSNRDILAFSHYEELVRISVEIRPLVKNGS